MPQAAFEALEDAVEGLTLERPDAGAPPARCLEVAGWALRYAWDGAERTLTLLDLTPSPAAPP